MANFSGASNSVDLLGDVVARYGRQALQLLTALAGLTGLFYTIGFIIVNVNLLQLGVYETALISVGYIAPGVAFALLLLLVGLLTVGALTFSMRLLGRTRLLRLLAVVLGISIVGAVAILLGYAMWFFRNLAQGVTAWSFIVGISIALLAFAEHLPLARRMIAQRSDQDDRALTWLQERWRSPVFVLAAVVLTFASVLTYGIIAYGQVPPVFGGGLPIVVRFFGQGVDQLQEIGIQLEPGEDRLTQRVELIAQTEDRYIVLLGNRRAVSFDKTFVQGIRYEPPEFFLQEAFFLQTHTGYGLGFLAKGRLDEALSEFNLVLDRDLNYVEALRGRVRIRLTDSHLNLDQAFDDYRRLINLNDRIGTDHYGLATVLVLRAQSQEQAIPINDVLADLTQAAELDGALLERVRADRLFDALRGNVTFDTAIYGSGASAARWFDGSAKAHASNGAFDDALLDYTRAISYALQYQNASDRLSPSEIAGLYMSLSEVHRLRDPRSEQALAALHDALKVANLDPLQISELHVRLSDLYLERDPLSEEAPRELQAAASVEGLSASQAADLYVRASEVYRQHNQLDEATQTLNRAAGVPGLSPSRALMLLNNLSTLYLQMDRFDEAAQALIRAAGVEGVSTSEAVGLYINVSKLYAGRNRFDDAARALEQAVLLPGVGPNELFELYFQLSNLYRQANRPAQATDALQKAASIEGLPAAQFLVGQGRIALEEGQYDAARDRFAQASELTPTDASVWYDYARALAALGDAGSETALHRAIALDFNLAVTARNTDDWTRYFATANSAIQNLINAALRVKEARALRDQGQLDQAVAAYLEAVTLDPAPADYWNEFGKVLTQAKRFAEAVIAYQNALQRVGGRDAVLLTALGLVQIDANDGAGAVVSLTEAISVQGDATPVRTYVSLARAHELNGSYDVAAETYAQALLREPGNQTYIYRIGINRLLAGQSVQGQEALQPIIAQGGLRVEATDGAPLREAPGVDGPVLKVLAVGSVLGIAGDPTVVASQVWWPVLDSQNTTGFVRAASVAPSQIAATLVTPVQVAPTSTP